MGGPPPGQGNWINAHLVYTHGFGVVAATANSVQAQRQPDVHRERHPAHRQRFSCASRGSTSASRRPATRSSAARGGQPGGAGLPERERGGQQNNTYRGGGGVAVGSPLNRLLYAVKFRELNILLSGAINSNSKILYDQHPLARVAKVAPFLTLDGETYPVVADGQIYWVVDGYTTTDLYPVLAAGQPGPGHLDQLRAGRLGGRAADGQVNYIRNSVKAVVNAYTGAVTLYAWDPQDPILQTWMKAFPGIIKPKQDIPGYLMPHLRYPPDLFEVQRQMLAQYHVLQRSRSTAGRTSGPCPTRPATTPGQPAAVLPDDDHARARPPVLADHLAIRAAARTWPRTWRWTATR